MERVAVLASGGLDSAVLIADLAAANEVFPIYVQFGLRWEAAEQAALSAYLVRLDHPNVAPLTLLQIPVRAVYGEHWSTTGAAPAYDAPDETVYLPGRNVLLIGLTAMWCSLHDVPRIAIGSLDHNPFPDATPAFFQDYARLLSSALAHQIEVLAPYRGREKWQLIREHAALPLTLTLTCMGEASVTSDTVVHCGLCNKCRERHEAFIAAGVPDPTPYAVEIIST